VTDDFTKTLLHHNQDARLTPSGGWLNLEDLRSLMGLSIKESLIHLNGPLMELFNAGMIEKRFNAVTANDEVRSRGVKPVMGIPHPHDDKLYQLVHGDDEDTPAPPAAVNLELETLAREFFIYLYRHGGFVTDTDLMAAVGSPTLGMTWAALSQLEAAGLTQRRLNNGRAVRLHSAVRDMLT
jgi:hypothetical protein